MVNSKFVSTGEYKDLPQALSKLDEELEREEAIKKAKEEAQRKAEEEQRLKEEMRVEEKRAAKEKADKEKVLIVEDKPEVPKENIEAKKQIKTGLFKRFWGHK